MNNHLLTATAAAALILAACGPKDPPAAPKAVSPAKVDGPKWKEGELASVTLTPEAETRLGVGIAEVAADRSGEQHRFLADVVLPPGRSLIVAAPVAGTLRPAPAPPVPGTAVKQGQEMFAITPLLPLPRDLRVTAEADVEQARTRVETAKLRKARADKMLKDEVGTVRAQEDARNELELAASALQAADARLEQIRRAPLEGDVTVGVRAPRDGMVRQLLAAPGQPVTGGAALFEIADFGSMWLRVPIYAGEAAQFSAAIPVSVETLSNKRLGVAHPVPAPPMADPLAATVDFYYQAPPGLKPGEKVAVAMTSAAAGNWKRVPFGAVVYDIHGGTWVYEQSAGHRYVRRRVQVDHTTAGMAYLTSGVAAGTPVVTAGAAELWGVEFGAGK